ncbi:VAN3-binding protein-like [Musa acuminata AAA Group]|uniref:VAN3-binding protein-like n=1 Tax=Musa acuminata AAA Group TaxID=214697 RepID=UPI0031DF463D
MTFVEEMMVRRMKMKAPMKRGRPRALPLDVLRATTTRMLNVHSKMERARRGVKFESVSFSRHLSLPYFTNDKLVAFEERGAIEACKEKSQLSTFYCPVEVPKSPVEAMDFLSRTWSPSSSDFFQMLSSNGREHDQELEEKQTEESDVHFDEDDKLRLEQVLTLLSTGNLVQSAVGKHKQLHTSWMKVGEIKAWLGGELFSSLSRGCRKRRKERLRLHVAQVHAALSVTRLAAAISGIMASSRVEPRYSKGMSMMNVGGKSDEKISAVLASAAALVATVCAEAAESAGAHRECVASAITTGLATKTSADMATLTATAATCLRGAATLERRAAAGRHVSQDQNILARGAQLPVRMPEGRVHLRLVYIFLKHYRLTVRLTKKYMRGVISTYKEYRIFHAMEDLKGGFSKDAHGFYLITLGTTGGAIQVMFEDQIQYRIWRSTICHLLCDC